MEEGILFTRLFSRHLSAQQRMGLVLAPDAVAWVVLSLSTESDLPKVMAQGCIDRAADDWARQLQRAILAQRVSRVPVSMVLWPGSYQLFMVEAPEVSAEELREAVCFRVRDMLLQPLEDTALDACFLPADAFRGHRRMCFVVATARAFLSREQERLATLGLRVDVVDVVEFTLRNLAALATDRALSHAVLFQHGQVGVLGIYQQDQAYLLRLRDAVAASFSAEQTAVELQKSFDYFESQIGKGLPKKLLLCGDGNEQTAEALHDLLGVQVSRLVYPGLKDDNPLLLLAAGAALREWEAA